MGQCAHLRNYATIDACEVVAIAELRPQLRELVATRYGIEKTYASAAEMLAAESLDGIVASQPFTHHGQIIAPLYESGIPIFTEKPLAASIEVGEQLLAALAAGGGWHMVGYHKRSDPAVMYAVEEIRRLKETGELGNMKYVRITMPPGDWVASGFREMISTDEKIPPMEADPPASDLDDAGVGMYVNAVNFYVHQVNLLRYLLGETYRVVYADPSGVLLVAETETGVSGIIEMGTYGTSIDWQESAMVCFNKGWIKLDLPAPLAHNRPGRVELYRDPGDGAVPQSIVPQLPWVHAMRQQAINFCSAIRGEIDPPCDAAEALEDLKVHREHLRLRKGK
jgi:predicted dehydrogenase